MIKELIINIITGLIVAAILVIIGIILRKHLWYWIKKTITLILTDSNIASVCCYSLTKKN